MTDRGDGHADAIDRADGEHGAPSDSRPLGVFVVADSVVVAAAGVVTMAGGVLVADQPRLTALGAFVVGSAGLMLVAIPLTRGGRSNLAMWVVGASTWSGALVAAHQWSFTWPLCLLHALMPGVIAATHVVDRQLRWFAAASLLVAFAVVALGVLRDPTPLTVSTPAWLRHAIVVGIAPLLASLLAVVAYQHQSRLRSALELERIARRSIDDQADELQRSRQRILSAADRARQRFTDTLRDGPQAELIGISLMLSEARRHAPGDVGSVDGALEEIREQLRRTHAHLRRMSHGSFPPELAHHGVVAALSSWADTSGLDVRFDGATIRRVHDHVEATVFFCVRDVLEHAARLGGAAPRRRVVVELGVDDDAVRFAMRGDVDPARWWALVAADVDLADRLGAAGAHLVRAPDHAAGAHLTGSVPLADPSA